jgi:uncharacterized protein YeaO (DUF488 family)
MAALLCGNVEVDLALMRWRWVFYTISLCKLYLTISRTAINIRQKRVYDPPSPDDGLRVLIDGLWPRGISRERAAIDLWARELAPSNELRRWYGHRPERFDEFDRRYRAELDGQRDRLTELREAARSGRVTILFGARDVEHSNATVLVDVLRHGLPRQP